VIRIAEERLDDGAWAELAGACGGNPLHLEAVTAADYPGSAALRLVFRGAERSVGCALAYATPRRRWRWLPAGRDLELPTFPAVTAGGEGRRAAVDALVAFARGNGYRTLVVRPRFGDSLEDLPHLGPYATTGTLEFVVDLRKDWDAVRAAMHRFHRKNVRRAERESLEVASDPSVAGLLALRDLQMGSARRSAERGGGFHVRETAYFEKVHALVYAGGLGDVVFAKSEGRVLAGLAWVAGARKGITVRSGSTAEGYDRGAMYLLQDAVLREAHRRGLEELNLGGVPEGAREPGHVQHGLYDFKRGFGGAERVRRGFALPLRGNGAR
jgi:hypothetical protein